MVSVQENNNRGDGKEITRDWLETQFIDDIKDCMRHRMIIQEDEFLKTLEIFMKIMRPYDEQ